MLAFWNGGSPQVVRNVKRVKMPNGDVRLNATPAPDDDLYAFVPGAKPGKFERIASTSYDNDGWTITETNTFVDMALDAAKVKRKAEVTARFHAVRDGGMTVDLGGGDVVLATTNEAVVELKGVRDFTAGGTTQKAVTRSGARVTFNNALVVAAITAIEGHISAANDREFDLHASIDGAADMTALMAIDIESGWPANPEGE